MMHEGHMETEELGHEDHNTLKRKQMTEYHCWPKQGATGGRREFYVGRGQVPGQELARLEPIGPRKGLCGPPC